MQIIKQNIVDLTSISDTNYNLVKGGAFNYKCFNYVAYAIYSIEGCIYKPDFFRHVLLHKEQGRLPGEVHSVSNHVKEMW